MPRLLELFCGNKSISKWALGYEVISIDIDKRWSPTHCVDILKWDYQQYPPNYFDVIWASPPCTTFSTAKWSNIGRHGITRESCQQDIFDKGLPPLMKTLEIINYFQPKVWMIENPRDGRMRHFMGDLPYTDCAYCQYGMPYRKRTRIWNNIGLKLKSCQCVGRHSETLSMGRCRSTHQMYVIPELLVKEIFSQIDNFFLKS